MRKINISIILIAIITLLAGCNSSTHGTDRQSEKSSNAEIADTDSTKLTILVRQVYKWHMTSRLSDFPYKFQESSDTIFIGIDWEVYNKTIEVFKKTGFFTDNFLSFHKTIALNIDSSMKKADIKFRNINDGIPLWDTNGDDWCGCQDYPDNYWDSLILNDLRIDKDYAGFYWTWNINPGSHPHKYKMTARKTGDRWRINSMEGFKYYGNVEYYDQIMKD